MAVRLALLEEPRLHREVTLRLTARSEVAQPRVRLAIRLPAEVQRVGGSLDREVTLAPGADAHLEVRVVPAAPGHYRLGATAEVLEGPYAGQVSGAVLDLDVSP